jgi:hypothetical protein
VRIEECSGRPRSVSTRSARGGRPGPAPRRPARGPSAARTFAQDGASGPQIAHFAAQDATAAGSIGHVAARRAAAAMRGAVPTPSERPGSRRRARSQVLRSGSSAVIVALEGAARLSSAGFVGLCAAERPIAARSVALFAPRQPADAPQGGFSPPENAAARVPGPFAGAAEHLVGDEGAFGGAAGVMSGGSVGACVVRSRRESGRVPAEDSEAARKPIASESTSACSVRAGNCGRSWRRRLTYAPLAL